MAKNKNLNCKKSQTVNVLLNVFRETHITNHVRLQFERVYVNYRYGTIIYRVLENEILKESKNREK